MHSGQAPKAVAGPSKVTIPKRDSVPHKKAKVEVPHNHRAPMEAAPAVTTNGVAQVSAVQVSFHLYLTPFVAGSRCNEKIVSSPTTSKNIRFER